MELKIIKSKKDYEEAIKVLDSLIDLNPDLGTTEGNRLEVLATIVENYEKEHFPIEKPNPIEAIKIRMDDLGFRQQDLVQFIGSKSKVSEVLSGKRQLTLQMIKNLHKGLGIPAEILLQDNSNLRKENWNFEWEKFPIKEIIKRNWIATNLKGAKLEAEEIVNRLLSKISTKIPDQVFYRKGFHERAGRKMNEYALLAWHIRIIDKAEKGLPAYNFNWNELNEDFLKELVKLSWFEKGPSLAKEYLEKIGIILVFEKHLPKTYLDGASFMLEDSTPVIALTLRHDRIDNFWFALMHELGHIYLHLLSAPKEIFFDDFEADLNLHLKEKEADKFARDAFIPRGAWVQSDARNTKNPVHIMNLAREYKIHPGIIAGRIRYESKNYKILNQFVSFNTRGMFSETGWE